MSVYLRSTGGEDTLDATFGSALTLGMGAQTWLLWVKVLSAPAVASEILNAHTSGGTLLYSPFRLNNGSPTDKLAAMVGSSDYLGTYQFSTSAWYGMVFSCPDRAGANPDTARLRIFGDHASDTTPLADETRTDWVQDLTTVQRFHFGVNSGGQGTTECRVTSLKMCGGAELSNAECRTELLKFGWQAALGSYRYAWKLKDIDADTDGLNEASGSGPNFSNSGGVTSADMPTNLSEPATGPSPIFFGRRR